MQTCKTPGNGCQHTLLKPPAWAVFSCRFIPVFCRFLRHGHHVCNPKQGGDGNDSEARGRSTARLSGSTVTQTATFTRRRDAEAWAREVEVVIENGALEACDKLSFGDVLPLSCRGNACQEKRAQWTVARLKAFLCGFPHLAQEAVEGFSRRGVVLWRQYVSDGTVSRAWNTLSAAWSHAARVWGLALPEHPFRMVACPAAVAARSQCISVQDVQGGIAHSRDTKNGDDRCSPVVAARFLQPSPQPLSLCELFQSHRARGFFRCRVRGLPVPHMAVDGEDLRNHGRVVVQCHFERDALDGALPCFPATVLTRLATLSQSCLKQL